MGNAVSGKLPPREIDPRLGLEFSTLIEFNTLKKCLKKLIFFVADTIEYDVKIIALKCK